MKVYTYNNKVLVNSANDKWLMKAPPPSEVTIGTQVWKNSNLAIDDGQGGITIKDGVYYYTLAAAVRVTNSIDGWHIPSYQEFKTLVNYVGSTDTEIILALAANSNRWSTPGNDTYGFGMLPDGHLRNGDYYNYNDQAMFICSYNNSVNSTYYFYMNDRVTGINGLVADVSWQYNIRLIKDS